MTMLLNKSTNDARKPEIIAFYDGAKETVDTIDEMCGSYNAGRNNRKRPLTISFRHINTAGLHKYITTFILM